MKPKKKKIEGGVIPATIDLSDKWFNEQYALAAKRPKDPTMSVSGHYMSAKKARELVGHITYTTP